MYKNFKEDKFIEKLISEKKKVKISLQEGFVYTGFVVGMSENSILFQDKFKQEMMIFMKDIRRILVFNSEGKN